MKGRAIFIPPLLSRRYRGFTLTELLVVMTLAALVCGMGSAVFLNARRKARQVEELAALRRVIQAYQAMIADHNGEIPLAYDEVTPIQQLDVTMPDGRSLLTYVGQAVVVRRLPWRMGPYLDWAVERTFVTWANREGYESSRQMSAAAYGLSISPAFGVNCYGLGGYRTRSAYSTDVAFRLPQIPQPEKMIAFAGASTFYVKPPNMAKSVFDKENPGWKEQSDEVFPKPEMADRYGNVKFCYEGKALVAFMDGHTELRGTSELRDSRLWSVQAQIDDDPARAVRP